MVTQVEEFLTRAAEEHEEYHFSEHSRKSSQMTELLCEHKNRGGVHFAHGLCKDCFDEVMMMSSLHALILIRLFPIKPAYYYLIISSLKSRGGFKEAQSLQHFNVLKERGWKKLLLKKRLDYFFLEDQIYEFFNLIFYLF